MNIISYDPSYKEALLEISLEWLNRYDLLEEADIEMLSHPEAILENGGHIFLAQAENQEIVGMVMSENQGDVCEILKLGVKEKARGSGAGRALMEAALNTARLEQKKKAVLCSNHRLTSALRLYESLGFQFTDYEKNHFELSDVSMELYL